MKRLMFAVAIGDQYVRQAQVMTDSFRQYNREWETKVFNERELNLMLPRDYQRMDAFFKCEIGRWYVMRQVILNHYDVALYCDNDMYWYGEYPVSGHAFTLSPHYLTDSAKRDAAKWLIKDGIPNLGMFEACGQDGIGIVNAVIDEVSANATAHYHGRYLWLQNLASHLPHIGYDVDFMTDAGLNVARWNIAHGDRILSRGEDGGVMVTCGGVTVPLRSFHFSSKSISSLDRFGDITRDLRDEYLRRLP